MPDYGQFCTVARGAEIFGELWTPLVVRELLRQGVEIDVASDRRYAETVAISADAANNAVEQIAVAGRVEWTEALEAPDRSDRGAGFPRLQAQGQAEDPLAQGRRLADHPGPQQLPVEVLRPGQPRC